MARGMAPAVASLDLCITEGLDAGRAAGSWTPIPQRQNRRRHGGARRSSRSGSGESDVLGNPVGSCRAMEEDVGAVVLGRHLRLHGRAWIELRSSPIRGRWTVIG